MSLNHRAEENVFGRVLSAFKFQKTENTPTTNQSSEPSINRLRDVGRKSTTRFHLFDRLRHSFQDKGQPDIIRVAIPLPPVPASPSVSSSTMAEQKPGGARQSVGQNQGIAYGANTAEAIARLKAEKRATVTNTRLTALKTYLEKA